MEIIQSFDWAVLDGIQQVFSCGFLDTVMPVITALGNIGAVWLIAAAVMLFFKKYRRCGVDIILVTAVGALLINLIIKPLVARDRPCWINEDIELLVAIPQDYSFPSGHSFQSFASATVIFIHHRRMGILAFALAMLIAFSRLYLYVHFPTDVLCGIAIGIVLAIAVCAVSRRIKKLDKLLKTE